MKILHLSDLHFCTSFKRDNISKTKKVLRKALEQSFDHLVITGDISDNSNVNDYEILKGILRNFGLYSSDKTTIVIGNHDIFGGIQTAFDLLNFPKKCMSVNYEEKINEFVGTFKELFKNTKSLIDDSHFPFIKEIGDTLFIGMNSIGKYSKLKNAFASNGKISDEQLFAVSKELNKEKYFNLSKILLVHHHFYKNKEQAYSSNRTWNKIESFTLKLRGKKRIFRFLIENDINLVLHGHSHENREYERKGINFINAGSCIDNFSKNAFYYLIEKTEFEFNYKLHSINSTTNLEPQENLEMLVLSEYDK